MMLMKNFTSEMKEKDGLAYLFFTDEDGNDWYESQKLFSEDTLKIMFTAPGVIVCASRDVSTLAPENVSVAEVDAAEIPAEALDSLTDGSWCYLDGKVQPYQPAPDVVQVITQKLKAELLAEADTMLYRLTLAVKHNMATDEEKALLEAWEKYSVLLNRVDTDKPVWPDKPA
ncbi:tail fiber assembly protein [Trabulsiella odontotermitis]|uniref:Tail fiber assembly protein n=1 Tax=Trabulsiella odontotermitis TaxID=379893 RepID=A0A0L0GY80_9ENTR|nr:tail assembly chaperone [Trabulsiella odontotermitis]KNC94145.1 hypothetical protein GM31_16360 [Trabulsiella odontotermitis]